MCQPAWVVHLSAARAVSPDRRLDSRQHSCGLKGTVMDLVLDLKAQLWTPIQRSSDTFIAASAKPPCCASMQCSLLKRNHCTIKASTILLCTIHSALCIMHYAAILVKTVDTVVNTDLDKMLTSQVTPLLQHLLSHHYCVEITPY